MKKIELTEKSAKAFEDKKLGNLKQFNFLAVDSDGGLCLFVGLPHLVKGDHCKEDKRVDMWMYNGKSAVCQIHPDTKCPEFASSLFPVSSIAFDHIMVGH